MAEYFYSLLSFSTQTITQFYIWICAIIRCMSSCRVIVITTTIEYEYMISFSARSHCIPMYCDRFLLNLWLKAKYCSHFYMGSTLWSVPCIQLATHSSHAVHFITIFRQNSCNYQGNFACYINISECCSILISVTDSYVAQTDHIFL